MKFFSATEFCKQYAIGKINRKNKFDAAFRHMANVILKKFEKHLKNTAKNGDDKRKLTLKCPWQVDQDVFDSLYNSITRKALENLLNDKLNDHGYIIDHIYFRMYINHANEIEFSYTVNFGDNNELK